MRWLMMFAVVGACGAPSKEPAESRAPLTNTAPKEVDEPAPDARAEEPDNEVQEHLAEAERLQRDLYELDAKVSGAVDAVVAAPNDAERSAASARLKELQKQKYELEERIDWAKARAERAKREQGTKISPECQANPLAKGCT